MELEQQTLRLSELSKQKFQLEYDKTRTRENERSVLRPMP